MMGIILPSYERADISLHLGVVEKSHKLHINRLLHKLHINRLLVTAGSFCFCQNSGLSELWATNKQPIDNLINPVFTILPSQQAQR